MRIARQKILLRTNTIHSKWNGKWLANDFTGIEKIWDFINFLKTVKKTEGTEESEKNERIQRKQNARK